MATKDFSTALPAPAHPLARPGYGKRAVPDQPPRQSADFDGLPPREGYIARFIDRLPEGAAMDAKSLAKALPLYGQQAVRTALNDLSAAGHLRRMRQPVSTGTGHRWVFRTYWSRVPHDSAWWARFLGDDTQEPAPAPEPVQVRVQVQAQAQAPAAAPAPVEETARSGVRSPAYDALARVGLRDPRLALSHADCAALEGLAAQWLARGATAELIAYALTSGLPEEVRSPRPFARKRLVDRMPPVLSAPPVPSGPHRVPRAMMDCTDCGVPGRPEALLGGLCTRCRGGVSVASPVPPSATGPDTRFRASEIREALAVRRECAPRAGRALPLTTG